MDKTSTNASTRSFPRGRRIDGLSVDQISHLITPLIEDFYPDCDSCNPNVGYLRHMVLYWRIYEGLSDKEIMNRSSKTFGAFYMPQALRHLLTTNKIFYLEDPSRNCPFESDGLYYWGKSPVLAPLIVWTFHRALVDEQNKPLKKMISAFFDAAQDGVDRPPHSPDCEGQGS